MLKDKSIRDTVEQFIIDNDRVPTAAEELKLKHTENFKKDYERIKPKSKEEFNKNRSKGTLGWQSIAKCYDCTSWHKLINTLDLPIFLDRK